MKLPSCVEGCCLILFLTSLSLAQSVSLATSNGTAPTINLGYVSYAGYQNSTAGINYYRGIPYAQAPVGNLRWQKPQPIEKNNNFSGQVMNATKIAPACYQSVPLSIYPPPGTFNESFGVS